MKNCKLCRYSELCNSLSRYWDILVQYLAVALIGMFGYLFISQKFLH